MADTTIKLSGTYDSIEAYNILEEMRNMGADYADIKTEAEEAATQATAAVATAQAAVTNATTASNNAQTYAGNANDSATAAAGSASSASTAATNALDSQTAAAGSASAAATSASEASVSETNAAASATAAALAITPTGSVLAFAGSTSPAGWLLCDGSAVSRTDYAALFAVIGTTYGSGDGNSTFNLPNLVDKFVEGSATSGTVKAAGLPNITGAYLSRLLQNQYDNIVSLSGAFDSSRETYGANAGQAVQSGTTTYAQKVTFDASRSSSVYGNSTTVQPPAVTMRYIIKY